MANTIKVNGGNASGSVIKLITKSITSDGTYDAADDNANGYSEVNVSLINITKFRYVKWRITSIWGNQYFQVSELGFSDTSENKMTMPVGYSATSSLPLLSIYTIDNLFDGDTNTKIVTEFHSGDVEDITIDFGNGNELDITQYPYYYWGSSDDDETYRGRTPLVWQFFGANESDFSDAVLLDEVTNFTPYVKNKEMAYRGLMVSTMRNSLPLITKSISANGAYDASDDNAIGYSSVTVTVSSGGQYDTVLTNGIISTDVQYATANFSDVSDYTTLLIKIKKDGYSGYAIVNVADIGSGISFVVNSERAITCLLTKTSISSTNYSGNYRYIYADILATNDAIQFPV